MSAHSITASNDPTGLTGLLTKPAAVDSRELSRQSKTRFFRFFGDKRAYIVSVVSIVAMTAGITLYYRRGALLRPVPDSYQSIQPTGIPLLSASRLGSIPPIQNQTVITTGSNDWCKPASTLSTGCSAHPAFHPFPTAFLSRNLENQTLFPAGSNDSGITPTLSIDPSELRPSPGIPITDNRLFSQQTQSSGSLTKKQVVLGIASFTITFFASYILDHLK
jgi:hypothetical protein